MAHVYIKPMWAQRLTSIIHLQHYSVLGQISNDCWMTLVTTQLTPSGCLNSRLRKCATLVSTKASCYAVHNKRGLPGLDIVHFFTTITTKNISDGVSRLGLCLETRLETHFHESRYRSRRFQIWRLCVLQINGLLKIL